MEIIVVASIIGFAVACFVFALGRTLIERTSAPDELKHQPEPSITASASPAAAGEAVRNITQETDAARGAEPVRDVKAPKKTRKSSAARSQEGAAKTTRRRRQKTDKPTAPAPEMVAPATTGPPLGTPAAPDLH
jgi:hypothetical protein